MAAHSSKRGESTGGLTLEELAARIGERTRGLFTHAIGND
jgi:hypothetical protein